MLFIERLIAAVVLALAVALIGLSLWLAPGGRLYDGPDVPFREADEQWEWGIGAEEAGTGTPPPFVSSAQRARVRMRTAP